MGSGIECLFGRLRGYRTHRVYDVQDEPSCSQVGLNGIVARVQYCKDTKPTKVWPPL